MAGSRLPRRAAIAAAALLLPAMLATSACGDDDSGYEFSVVATTTVLGDLTMGIVGDAGTVDVLLPIGIDPHEVELVL